MKLREAKERVEREHPDWTFDQKVQAIQAIRDLPGDPNWVQPPRARPFRAVRKAIADGVRAGIEQERQRNA